MLSENVEIRSALPAATGTADRQGNTIDMSGFDGIVAVVTLGAVGAGGAKSVKMQQGDMADMSDASDLVGTSVPIADDDDDMIVYAEVYQPTKRYVRCVVSKGGASVEESGIYLMHRAKVAPVTQGATIQGVAVQAPKET